MSTILVVEDETPLRNLLCTLLRNAGHEVYAAADGLEALALVFEHSGSIDLVVADVRMPRMGGTELYRHLRQVGGGLRVLLISGYTQGQDLDAPFLSKPFTPEILLRKVDEVLNSPNAAAGAAPSEPR